MADDLYQSLGVQAPGLPAVDLTQDNGDLYKQFGVAPVAHMSAAPANATNWLEDLAHHATFGVSDKLEAALKAANIMPGGVNGPDFSTRYHKTLTNVRSDIGDYGEENPGWAGDKSAKAVSDLGGLALAAIPETRPASMLGAAAKSAGIGAGLGAAAGFGSTDDESLGQDLGAAGIGALAGGVTGGALPIGLGIGAAPFRLGARAAGAFGKSGIEGAAGRVLNDAAGGAVPNFDTAPLPGMKLTTGQSTNDPGLLWLERSVADGSRGGAAMGAESRTANNSAIRTGISDLGDTSTDASTAMSEALDRAHANAKAATGALWKKADVQNTGGVSGFQFNNFMQKHINSLPIADQAMVRPEVAAVMGQMADAKTQNLGDVQSVRSMLSGMATKAGRSGDTNTARVLGNLADKTEDFIDMKAANLGQTIPAYNDARASTRQMKQTFTQPPAVRKALGVDAYGADKLPVSATADHFINTGKGAPEAFNSYLNAIATKDPATGAVTYDPAGLKAAQDAFAQKFLNTVQSAGTDANGNRLVSPAKMQKFMGDYGHVINSPAFDQSQRDLMGNISRATQMASRTANARSPGAGSDTFAKLSGDKFIDALIGPGASKIINTVGTVGGGLAGAAHGMGDMVLGALGGEKGAGIISNFYNAPREKALNLVTEAMHDPQLARDLMMKASNSNFKLLPAPRRTKILGLLGAQTAPMAANALSGDAQ